MGKFPTVAIYDYNVAKELFSQEDLTGRPDNFAYRFRTLGKRQGNSNCEFLKTFTYLDGVGVLKFYLYLAYHLDFSAPVVK